MKKLKFINFFCLLWLAQAAFAQEKPLIIMVKAKGTGKLIPRAEINFVPKIDAKIYTNKEGIAEVALPANFKKLTVYRSGYELYEVTKQELASLEAMTIYLFPAAPDDNEVIIRGRKRFEVSKKTVSISEAKKIAPRGDVVQVTKLLPGVQSDSFGPNIIVRGSGPQDSKYYVDEWTVPFIFHSIGGISVLNPELLSDIEFNSGGFSSRYGEATGGVIAIRTKQEIPEDDRLEWLINLPLYSGIFYETPIGKEGKAFASFGARRSYLEAILPRVLPDDMDLTLTPYFSDAQAYYYRQLDNGHLKWIFLTAIDGLKALFPTDISDNESGTGKFDISQSFYTTGIEWQTKATEDWTLNLSPQITHFENNFNFLDVFFRLYVNSFNLRTELSKRRSRYERTYIGAEIVYGYGTVKTLSPVGDFSDPFFDIEEAERILVEDTDYVAQTSLWGSYDYKLHDLIFSPGLRLLHSSLNNKSTADPRFSMRWLISKSQTLKYAMGQYSQSPNFRDATEEFGNESLEFIRTNQYVLGIESEWTDKWKTDFQVFHKKKYNLIEPHPTKNVDSTGSGESNGFEAFIRRNQTAQFFAWLSYTYSQNKERENDQLTYRNSEYDQTHIANLAFNWAFSSTWDLGGRFAFHTGDTYTSVDDAVYNANLDKYQQRRDETSRLFNKRLPDFHELNIYFEKDWLFDEWKTQFRFGVEFLSFSPQTRDVQYNYDYSKEEYFTSLPPIPYIEVKGVL